MVLNIMFSWLSEIMLGNDVAVGWATSSKTTESVSAMQVEILNDNLWEVIGSIRNTICKSNSNSFIDGIESPSKMEVLISAIMKRKENARACSHTCGSMRINDFGIWGGLILQSLYRLVSSAASRGL